MEEPSNMPLSELYFKYKKFVVNNHGLVGNMESAIKILSYFAPGRGDHSVVVAELLYSASNLLVFLNDSILRQAANIKLKVPLPQPELCRWLSVLEHVEVFLEIAAFGFGGDVSRWLIILCVQIAKAAIKFILLLKHNSGIQQSPPIPGLKRGRVLHRKLLEAAQGEQDTMTTTDTGKPLSMQAEITLEQNNSKQTYTLKRSGRPMRTLQSAPPIQHRSWKVPSETPGGNVGVASADGFSHTPTTLAGNQLIGECLHISRPLAHLFSMYLFGTHSWKPWLLACGMDLSSISLMGDSDQYNSAEREELRRRSLLMIVYLLRSPFYDKYSKVRLMYLLKGMAKYIPGVRLVVRPLLDYLPWWQRVYFYVWMT